MPKLFDMVRIGSLQQGDIQVPLSRFCYAYLCGKISKLFPENFDRTILSVAHPGREFRGIECHRAWAGISPNISGNFTPFVFFNQVFLSFSPLKEGRRIEIMNRMEICWIVLFRSGNPPPPLYDILTLTKQNGHLGFLMRIYIGGVMVTLSQYFVQTSSKL